MASSIFFSIFLFFRTLIILFHFGYVYNAIFGKRFHIYIVYICSVHCQNVIFFQRKFFEEFTVMRCCGGELYFARRMFLVVHHCMNFYTTFLFSAFWFASFAFENVCKQRYCCGINDFKQILPLVALAAVRQKGSQFLEQIKINRLFV